MKEISAGLLGFGTVGAGVVRVFQKNSELMADRLGCRIVLKKIADLDTTSDRGVSVEAGQLTADVDEVLNDPDIRVVIELIGGYEPARTFVLQAIANGKHVVTANKALLAVHGREIFAAAEEKGVSVMFEAAVGGGIPIISPIKESLCANNFSKVTGILNGTCNYILTRMTGEGEDFAVVLKDAQDVGFAEADPTFDIEGIDTAHKLALLVSMCFGTYIDFNKVYTEGITNISALDIDYATQFGYKIKLLAVGKLTEGEVEARVHPTMVPNDYPLASVNGVFNSVELKGDFVDSVVLSGPGAGMDATASAVMGDVISITRDLQTCQQLRTPALGYSSGKMKELPVRSMDEISCQYYLRFDVRDEPGVLGIIASILGKNNIGISSMLQPERKVGSSVPVVLMTAIAKEIDVRKALAEIDASSVTQEATHLIRILSGNT